MKYIIVDTHNNNASKGIFSVERAAYAKRDKLEERRAAYGAPDGKRYVVKALEQSQRE